MKIITHNNKTIDEVIAILKKGGLVVSPSDTVYGLLADATNEKAVKKLIKFKNRPFGKPISVFVSDFSMLKEQVEINETQLKTVEELLPGPFTIILKSRHKVSNLLESEKGNLGVRMPDFKFINELAKKFNKPITATSSNISGRSPHYSTKTLLNELSDKKKELIDLIIDAGDLPRNKPSTVVDLTEAKIKIVRQGDISFNEEKKYISESPSQTKKIAEFIFKKIIDKKITKPLIFILQGELGVGKTVFIKGIGELLGIKNIISPTFVIYYEYEVHLRGVLFKNKLVHIDLYNINDPEEFRYLHLEEYIKKGNVLCFEWGEKAGEILPLLKKTGKVVYVKMKYIDDKKREINLKL